MAPDWVTHPDPVVETTPWFEIWRQLVPVFPRFEIVRREVEARVEIEIYEVVASVEVEREDESPRIVKDA